MIAEAAGNDMNLVPQGEQMLGKPARPDRFAAARRIEPLQRQRDPHRPATTRTGIGARQ